MPRHLSKTGQIESHGQPGDQPGHEQGEPQTLRAGTFYNAHANISPKMARIRPR